jgi:hypothetical protein
MIPGYLIYPTRKATGAPQILLWNDSHMIHFTNLGIQLPSAAIVDYQYLNVFSQNPGIFKSA